MGKQRRSCPDCGGRDILRDVKVGQGAQVGAIGLQFVVGYVLGGVEPLRADLCRECGTIVRLHVENTERFFDVAERRPEW